MADIPEVILAEQFLADMFETAHPELCRGIDNADAFIAALDQAVANNDNDADYLRYGRYILKDGIAIECHSIKQWAVAHSNVTAIKEEYVSDYLIKTYFMSIDLTEGRGRYPRTFQTIVSLGGIVIAVSQPHSMNTDDALMEHVMIVAQLKASLGKS